jgi:hypothetical protein
MLTPTVIEIQRHGAQARSTGSQTQAVERWPAEQPVSRRGVVQRPGHPATRSSPARVVPATPQLAARRSVHLAAA